LAGLPELARSRRVGLWERRGEERGAAAAAGDCEGSEDDEESVDGEEEFGRQN